MYYNKSLSYDDILEILDNAGYESISSIDIEDSNGDEITHSFIRKFEHGYVFDIIFPFDNDISPIEVAVELTGEDKPPEFRVDFVRGIIGSDLDDIHIGEYERIVMDRGSRYLREILDKIIKFISRKHPGAIVTWWPHEEKRKSVYRKIAEKKLGFTVKENKSGSFSINTTNRISKKVNGGIVKRYFAGGRVTTATGTDITGAGVDTQLINAMPGDFVVNRAAVRGMGHNFFSKVSKGVIPRSVNGGPQQMSQVAVQPGEVVIPSHNAMKFGIGNLLAINKKFGGRDANKPIFDDGIRTAAGGGLLRAGLAGGAASLIGNLIHPQLGAAVGAKILKPSEPAFSKLLGHGLASGLGAITHPGIGGFLSTSIITNDRKAASKSAKEKKGDEGDGATDTKIAKKIYAEIYKIRKNQEKFFKFVKEEFKDAKEKASLTDTEDTFSTLQEQYAQILNALNNIGLSKAGEDEKPKGGIPWGTLIGLGTGVVGTGLTTTLLNLRNRLGGFATRTASGARGLASRGMTGLRGLASRSMTGMRGLASKTAQSLYSGMRGVGSATKSLGTRLAGPASRVAGGFRANLGALGSKLSTARSIPRTPIPKIRPTPKVMPRPRRVIGGSKAMPNITKRLGMKSLMGTAGKGALGMVGRILMPATGVGIGLQLALIPTSAARADGLEQLLNSVIDGTDYDSGIIDRPKKWKFPEFLSRLATFPDVRKRFPLDSGSEDYYDMIKLFPDAAFPTSFKESNYGKSTFDQFVKIYKDDVYKLFRKTFLETIGRTAFDSNSLSQYIDILYESGLAQRYGLKKFLPLMAMGSDMVKQTALDSEYYNDIGPKLDIILDMIDLVSGKATNVNSIDLKKTLNELKGQSIYNLVFKMWAVNFENEKDAYSPIVRKVYRNHLDLVMERLKEVRSGKFDYILSNDRNGMSLDRSGLRNGGLVQTAFVGGLIQLGTKVLPRVTPMAVRGLKSAGRRGLLNHKIQKMLFSNFEYKDDLSALSDPDFRRFLGERDEMDEIQQPTFKESIFLPYTDADTGYVDYQQFSEDFLDREKKRKKLATQETVLPSINTPKWSQLLQPKPKKLAIPVPLPVQKPANHGVSAELLATLIAEMLKMNNKIDENQQLTIGTLSRVLDNNRNKDMSVPYSMPAGTSPSHSYIENLD